MTPHLLDVNALIALLWETHPHHNAMDTWFNRHAKAGWSTCAITQSGFVRIMNQPALAAQQRNVAESGNLLAHSLAHPAHSLLPLDLNFADVLTTCTGGLVGHRQVTDAYLLTAAIRAGMKLLTFDGGICTLLRTDAERRTHITVLR